MRSFPLFDLLLSTPLLSLRLPGDEDLDWLANQAVGNVLAPERKAFMGPWTQLPDGAFQLGVVQYNWKCRASFAPEKWALLLGVYPHGEQRPVGIMDLNAENFAAMRMVGTGSWLLSGWQGRGLGKQARSAVLSFAFEQLGALDAVSGAHPDNAPSHGVSRALGYREDGIQTTALHDGVREDIVRLRVQRADFRPACPVSVEGFERCRHMLAPLRQSFQQSPAETTNHRPAGPR